MHTLQTLHTLIDEMGQRGDAPCILALHRDDHETWSYAQVAEHARRLAAGLHTHGIQPGEPVALLAPNQPAWLVAALAVLAAGAVVIPIDSQIGDEHLGHILRDSEARVVFTTTSYTNRLANLELPASVQPILLDVAADDPRGWQAHMAAAPAPIRNAPPDEPAALFYTSGTTGVPKGVPLSHGNLAFQLQALNAIKLVQPTDRVMLPLPMYHVYPFTVGTLAPLALGVPLVLPHAMTGPQLVRALREGGVTILIGVPRLHRALVAGIERQVNERGHLARTLFTRLLALSIWVRQRTGRRIGRVLFGSLHRRFGGQLRVLASGGSALDPDLAWTLEGLGWELAIGYGLTETAPLLTLNVHSEHNPASVGSALPGVELRIDTSVQAVDSDPALLPTGGTPDQPGEILARGPGVFGGYRSLPDISAEVLTPDGWFRTGDLGYVQDGAVYINGRASTLIVTEGGKNIQPEPVEEVYQAHPFIREIGILQDQNQLVALVFPDMDAVNEQANGDAERAVREGISAQAPKLPSYQRIADYAVTREALPKTNLGKIRRHVLRERYQQARAGIATSSATASPIAIADMSEHDRNLLENDAAMQVWEWLAERYHDRNLTPDTSPQLDLGIDSLAWLNLTLDIRQRTGVELSEEAIKRVETVRDLLAEVAQAARGPSANQAALLAEPERLLSDEDQQWVAPIGFWLRLVGVFVFLLNRLLLRTFCRLKVRGLENVPANTHIVLAPNHTSYMDVFSVAGVLPYAQVRDTYWAGSVDVMFSNPFMRFVARLSQTMPVAGKNRGTGLSSLAFAALTLKRAHNLVWFPEGRISPSGELLPFRNGLGLVLHEFPTTVVPVYIHGTHDALPVDRAFPRPAPITVTFGKAVDTRALIQPDDSADVAAERVVQTLHERVAHLRDEFHGHQAPDQIAA